LRNPTGPVATPLLLETIDPFDLILEKENPFPPPDCCINAATLKVENIPSFSLPKSSDIGSTKQAANCPSGVPAPVNVGEFGKNFFDEIKL